MLCFKEKNDSVGAGRGGADRGQESKYVLVNWKDLAHDLSHVSPRLYC